MEDKGMSEHKSEKPAAPKVQPVTLNDRPHFPWPWGLVAIGFMALAWVGIYLIWNGVVFLSAL
jgi:hypothetical protein